jgi:hypothetical protein
VLLGGPAVTRQSVLTLYGHRSPEVGVPSENGHINERGLVITDFVDRVGDPVGLVAPDGSVHRGEVLVSEALRALLVTVTDGRSPEGAATVAYPAHWRKGAVDALQTALAGARQEVTLIPDATAAIAALQSDPGVPATGVIALCDFGGTGTSVTLLDAATGYRPIGPTMRHADFSGDLVDQALLQHVIADLATAGTLDMSSTSALGSLSRLRAQCRFAKERLSGEVVTALPVDVPGFSSGVRLTRTELDEEVRQPLAEFVDVLQDTLDRAGVNPADLAAVASVGGGANVPVITTTLSSHFRVPVITRPQAELIGASGAALRAARGPADDRATAMAPAAMPRALASAIADAGPQSSTFRALAWSEADDVPPVAPVADRHPYAYADAPAVVSTARPQLKFENPVEFGNGFAAPASPPWYQRPTALAGAVLVVVVLAATAAMVALRYNPSPTSSTTPLTAHNSAPAAVPSQAVVAPPPVTQVVQGPAPETVAPAPAAPAPTQDAPPPPAVGTDTPWPPAPSTVTVTQAPSTVTAAPAPTTNVAPTTNAAPTTNVAPTTKAAPTTNAAPTPGTDAPTPIQSYRPRVGHRVTQVPAIPGVPPLVQVGQ